MGRNQSAAIFSATVSQAPPSGSLVDWGFHYRDPAAKNNQNTNCTDASDPNWNSAVLRRVLEPNGPRSLRRFASGRAIDKWQSQRGGRRDSHRVPLVPPFVWPPRLYFSPGEACKLLGGEVPCPSLFLTRGNGRIRVAHSALDRNL